MIRSIVVRLGAIASLLAVSARGAGCHSSPGSAQIPNPDDRPPIAVRVHHVSSDEGAGRVWRAGVVEPIRRSAIGSRLMSRVVAVNVREGARVSGGDPLVVLDVRDIRARRDQVRANRSAIEAQATLAGSDLRRAETLGERGAIAESHLEAARGVLAVRQAEASGVASLGAEVDVQLGDGILSAPFDGFVVRRAIEVGQLTTPGAPALILEDDARVALHASIAARDVAELTIGETYPVRYPTGEEALGRLDAIVPSGDLRVPGLDAIFVVDNPERRFRSGVVASVGVPSSRTPSSRILVPAAAIVARGGLRGVYVVEGNRARLVWCSIEDGDDAGTFVVLDGLRSGEDVVADASVRGLDDGRRIEVRR